jgi:hypothetical protein
MVAFVNERMQKLHHHEGRASTRGDLGASAVVGGIRMTKETADAVEAAAYIASMARELCEIAARHELGFLVYLLTMTTEEAAAIRGDPKPRQESDAA